tara:strand:- start:366 stop:728 length:363 start_codon:yes stop_codon:yes gene_type:complete
LWGRIGKKLKEAAEYWVRGGFVDERDKALEAFGATAAQMQGAKAQHTEKDFEVWTDNWDTVVMFLRMSTQWNVSMTGATGLNYSSLEYLCKLYPAKDPCALFEGIQIMETAALVTMNSKK